jgi:hypothetical protein
VPLALEEDADGPVTVPRILAGQRAQRREHRRIAGDQPGYLAIVEWATDRKAPARRRDRPCRIRSHELLRPERRSSFMTIDQSIGSDRISAKAASPRRTRSTFGPAVTCVPIRRARVNRRDRRRDDVRSPLNLQRHPWRDSTRTERQQDLQMHACSHRQNRCYRRP